ncbi:MAG: addiction module protein [Nitrospirales bacterium]
MASCGEVWEDIYFATMAHTIPLDDLTADERIELMGRLWDSLDPALAAPITPDVVAELELREAEADSAPDAGEAWSGIRDDLRKKLK